jgi:hypothetical protein
MLVFMSKMQDACLEPTKNHTSKISRFPNAIIYDISLMMPIGSGKESCTATINPIE